MDAQICIIPGMVAMLIALLYIRKLISCRIKIMEDYGQSHPFEQIPAIYFRLKFFYRGIMVVIAVDSILTFIYFCGIIVKPLV